MFSIFLVKRQAFLYGFSLAVRRSKLVGGMCSVLPYGTGICFYAFIIFLYILIASVYLRKSGIDESTEWSTIPVFPSLMCFINRDGTEGTNASKILCLILVYVLFYVNLCQD